MVTTLGFLASTSRAGSASIASTMRAATATGSTPRHGAEACVPRPCTTMRRRSELAIAGPATTATSPAASSLSVWSAKIAVGPGFAKTPSFSMSGAPPSSPGGGPSSAGWNTNSTVPARRSRRPLSSSATPSRMATWASCPHACIAPSTSLANGRSVSSGIGNASMSPRNSTVRPGLPPSRTATSPEHDGPSFKVSGKPASAAFTFSNVFGVSRPSSGSS